MLMIVIIHVAAALASILLSALAIFYPSATKLEVCKYLVVTTFISGIYLTVSTKSHILQTCIMGLAYLATTLGLMVLAYRRLPHKT